MKLPSALAGGSVVTTTGLMAPHLPPTTMAAIVLAELVAFVIVIWAQTKRQRQGQDGALKLVQELKDTRISVVVRSDGQVEIQPVAADPSSSDTPGDQQPPAA